MEAMHRCSLGLDHSMKSGCRGGGAPWTCTRMVSRSPSADAVQEQKDKVVVTIEDYLWFWLHIIQPEDSLAPTRFTNFTLKELQVNSLQAPSHVLVIFPILCASFRPDS